VASNNPEENMVQEIMELIDQLAVPVMLDELRKEEEQAGYAGFTRIKPPLQQRLEALIGEEIPRSVAGSGKMTDFLVGKKVEARIEPDGTVVGLRPQPAVYGVTARSRLVDILTEWTIRMIEDGGSDSGVYNDFVQLGKEGLHPAYQHMAMTSEEMTFLDAHYGAKMRRIVHDLRSSVRGQIEQWDLESTYVEPAGGGGAGDDNEEWEAE
jgi:hypothetical protein